MAATSANLASRLIAPFLWIAALLRRTSPQAPAPATGPVVPFNPDPDYSTALEDVPRYPPFDRGLPAIPVDRVLDTQRALFDRIRNSDLPYVEEAVRNLANYVHLLPATSNDVFSGAGGLLRLCLETGFHSYVASQGNIFTSRAPAEKRRDLEPKWQLAAFLSGLCCELGRAINTSVVTNDRGEQWLPFEPLTVWLERTDSRRYFLRPPQSPPSQQTDPAHLSGIIINSIIPAAALQHITTDDRSILMEMLGAISRISDTFHSSHFARTIRHIRDLVIARDAKSNPRTFGTPLVGVHVEPYLINSMRHLIKNGSWKRNEKLARVHLAKDGCFLFWTTGVPEILDLLRQEGAVGIPSDPRTLGELLLTSGVFEGNGKPGGTDADGRSVLWWYIKPPGASTTYEVVKLKNPGIILEEDVIASTAIYPVNIIVPPPAPQPGTASPAQPAASAPSGAPLAALPSTPPPPVGTPGDLALVSSEDDVPQASQLHEAPAAVQAEPTGTAEVTSTTLNRALAVAADITFDPQAAAAAAAAAPQGQPASTGGAAPKQAAAAKSKAPSAKNQAAPPASAAPKPGASRKAATPASSDAEQSTAAIAAEEPVPDRIKKLRASTQGVLKKICDWHNDPDSNRKSLWRKQGLAIPVSLVQEAGFERGVLLTQLKEIKVVVFADGKASAMHTINNTLYFMVTREAALAIGFKADPEPEVEPQTQEASE
jgi:conjugal transfer pilus assembly protein TraI